MTLTFTGVAMSTASTIDFSLAGSILDVSGNGFAQVMAQTIDPAAAPADAGGPAAPAVSHTITTNVVTLLFGEMMDKTTAEAAAYATDKVGVNFLSAELGTDGLTVTVEFDGDPGNGGGGQNITVPATITDINGEAYVGANSLMIPN